MMLLIQEECNNLFSLICCRIAFLLLLSFLVAVFSVHWSLKHYRQTRRLHYESLPMLACCTQAILHTIQYSVYNCNQLVIMTSFFQLLTFAFVAQSLVNLCYRFKYDNPTTRKNKYCVAFFWQTLLYGLIFFAQLTLLFYVPPQGCAKTVQWAIYLTLAQLTLTTFVTLIYGCRLLSHFKPKAQTSAAIPLNASENFDSEVRTDLQIRLILVKRVVYGQVIALLLCFGLIVVIMIRDEGLLCYHRIGQNDHVSVNELLVVVFLVMQQLPCIFIPYLFYENERQPSKSVTTIITFSADAKHESVDVTNSQDFLVRMQSNESTQ